MYTHTNTHVYMYIGVSLNRSLNRRLTSKFEQGVATPMKSRQQTCLLQTTPTPPSLSLPCCAPLGMGQEVGLQLLSHGLRLVIES